MKYLNRPYKIQIITLSFILLIIFSVIIIFSRFISFGRYVSVGSNSEFTVFGLTNDLQVYWQINFEYPNLNDDRLLNDKNYRGNTNKQMFSEEGMEEFNRRICFYLEDIDYKDVDGPIVEKNKYKKKLDENGLEVYVDYRDIPLRVWWGRKNSNGYKKERFFSFIDIYSVGPNGIDETNGTDTEVGLNIGDDIANWKEEYQ